MTGARYYSVTTHVSNLGRRRLGGSHHLASLGARAPLRRGRGAVPQGAIRHHCPSSAVEAADSGWLPDGRLFFVSRGAAWQQHWGQAPCLHRQLGGAAGGDGTHSAVLPASAGPGHARAAQQVVLGLGACLGFGTEALPREGLHPPVQRRGCELAWTRDCPF